MKMRLRKKLSRLVRQKLRNSVLSHHGSAILAETWNGRMVVEAGDFAVGRTLLRDGSYDRPQIEWLIEGFGKHAELIVIVGTHVGSLMIPLSRACDRIVGFEPDTKNYSLLQTNLLLNQVANATTFNAAVGAEAGHANFARNSLNTGNSAITADNSPGAVKVATVSLDASLAELTQPIGLMVMDVEGYECQALKGAKATLERTERLYMEFAPEHLKGHGTSADELFDLLRPHFKHMYMLEDTVVHRELDEGVNYLGSISHKRHLLVNILLTKDPLPQAALAASASANSA